MADTTFAIALPPLLAVDNGDGTYSVAIVSHDPAPGTDTVFVNTNPPLKAVDLGDGTYALAAVAI